MTSYDPHTAPDPTEWLEADESERIMLVDAYHRDIGEELPNKQLHALAHVVVENQIAANDPPEARRALIRLLAEGLDRHEAVHAVGALMTEQMFDILKNKTPNDDAKDKKYRADLENLTIESWQARFKDAEDPEPSRKKRWGRKHRVRP